MSQQFEHFRNSIQSGGMAFLTDQQREPAYHQTTGWAERDGRWHLFVDGRTGCRRPDGQRHVITSTRQRLLGALPTGARICTTCQKRGRP